MKCALCPNEIVMETDPKGCDYKVISGAKRKTEEWDVKTTEVIELPDEAERAKRATDAMYRLEHEAQDVAKAKASEPAMVRLMRMKAAEDSYSQNADLRRAFRTKKKEDARQVAADAAVQARYGLAVSLVAEHPDDVAAAQHVRFGAETVSDRLAAKREALLREPVFPRAASAQRGLVASVDGGGARPGTRVHGSEAAAGRSTATPAPAPQLLATVRRAAAAAALSDARRSSTPFASWGASPVGGARTPLVRPRTIPVIRQTLVTPQAGCPS